MDIVVDVLLGAQKGARPLCLTITRHGSRRNGSRRRRHPASRGGEPRKIRTPHPRVGYTNNSGRGENLVAPDSVVPPREDKGAVRSAKPPGHHWR